MFGSMKEGYDVTEPRQDPLIFAHLMGAEADIEGRERKPPSYLSEDAKWTWTNAYDQAIKEKS